jgi:hypothetical protein
VSDVDPPSTFSPRSCAQYHRPGQEAPLSSPFHVGGAEERQVERGCFIDVLGRCIKASQSRRRQARWFIPCLYRLSGSVGDWGDKNMVPTTTPWSRAAVNRHLDRERSWEREFPQVSRLRHRYECQAA